MRHSSAAGRTAQAAAADALLAEVAWYRIDRERCDELLERAAASVSALPDSPEKAFVLSQVARYRMLADDDEAIPIGEQALEMAERLGLDELRAHALVNIGTARANRGDPQGLIDLERGAELGLALRSAEAARALNNLSSLAASWGDFKRQEELLREGIRVGEELGTHSIASFARATLVGNLFWTGKWDEGFQLAEEWLGESGGQGSSGELGLRRNRARALLARDDVEGALADISVAVDGSRRIREPQALLPGLGAAMRIYLELGREDEARELAAEVLEHAWGSSDWRILDLSFAAELLGYAEEFRPRVEGLQQPAMGAANLALVDGDYVRAAEVMDGMGMAFAAADARRLAATKLERGGRRSEAERELRLALAFYRPVRAVRYIRDCEALLGETSEIPA